PNSTTHTLSLHDALPIYGHQTKHLFPIRSSRRYQRWMVIIDETDGFSISPKLFCDVMVDGIVHHCGERRIDGTETKIIDGSVTTDRKSTRLNSSHGSISY